MIEKLERKEKLSTIKSDDPRDEDLPSWVYENIGQDFIASWRKILPKKYVERIEKELPRMYDPRVFEREFQTIRNPRFEDSSQKTKELSPEILLEQTIRVKIYKIYSLIHDYDFSHEEKSWESLFTYLRDRTRFFSISWVFDYVFEHLEYLKEKFGEPLTSDILCIIKDEVFNLEPSIYEIKKHIFQMDSKDIVHFTWILKPKSRKRGPEIWSLSLYGKIVQFDPKFLKNPSNCIYIKYENGVPQILSEGEEDKKITCEKIIFEQEKYSYEVWEYKTTTKITFLIPQFVRFVLTEKGWLFYDKLGDFRYGAWNEDEYLIVNPGYTVFDVFSELYAKLLKPTIPSFKTRGFTIEFIEGVSTEEIKGYLQELSHSSSPSPDLSLITYKPDQDFLSWVQEFIRKNIENYPIDNAEPEECALLYPYYLQRDEKGNPPPSAELKLSTGLTTSERTIQRRMIALLQFLKNPDVYRQLGELYEQYFLAREQAKGRKVIGSGGSTQGCDAIVDNQVYSLKCFHNERDKQIAIPTSEIAQAEIEWAKENNNGKIILVLMNPFWGKEVHKTVYISQLSKRKNIIFKQSDCLNPNLSL